MSPTSIPLPLSLLAVSLLLPACLFTNAAEPSAQQTTPQLDMAQADMPGPQEDMAQADMTRTDMPACLPEPIDLKTVCEQEPCTLLNTEDSCKTMQSVDCMAYCEDTLQGTCSDENECTNPLPPSLSCMSAERAKQLCTQGLSTRCDELQYYDCAQGVASMECCQGVECDRNLPSVCSMITLSPPDHQPGDMVNFGEKLDISGSTLAVSAPLQLSDNTSDGTSGAVYLYDISNITTLSAPPQVLEAPDGASRFGESVHFISPNLLAVAAPSQTNPVWLYKREAGAWSYVAELTVPPPTTDGLNFSGSGFGYAMESLDFTLYVSAPKARQDGTRGAVVVYELDPAELTANLQPSAMIAGPHLGESFGESLMPYVATAPDMMGGRPAVLVGDPHSEKEGTAGEIHRFISITAGSYKSFLSIAPDSNSNAINFGTQIVRKQTATQSQETFYTNAPSQDRGPKLFGFTPKIGMSELGVAPINERGAANTLLSGPGYLLLGNKWPNTGEVGLLRGEEDSEPKLTLLLRAQEDSSSFGLSMANTETLLRDNSYVAIGAPDAEKSKGIVYIFNMSKSPSITSP